MLNRIKFNKKRLIAANRIMVITRWLYTASLVITGILSKVTPGISANANMSPMVMALIALLTCFFNIYVWLFFKHGNKRSLRSIKAMNYIQFLYDQIVVTLVIFYAGGIISISFLYYLYPIVTAGFIFSLIEAAIFSTTASVLYVGLMALQFYDIIPYYSRYNSEFENILSHNPSAIITNSYAIVSTFYIVGILSGMMANIILKKESLIMREKDKNKKIIDNLTDGLVFLDNTDKIRIINRKAEELLRVSKKDVVGIEVADIKSEKQPILFQVIHNVGKNTIIPFGKPELSMKLRQSELRIVIRKKLEK
jgi:PAS domain-containing protein